MKLAEKILEKSKVEEKVQPSFFDDAEMIARKLIALKKDVDNPNLSDSLNLVISFFEDLDDVDEKGALKNLDLLKKFIKDLKIEK